MKKILALLCLCTLLFSSCAKNDNNYSNINTVSILDNGMDLSLNATNPASNENHVEVTLIKTASSSALILNVYNTSSARQFDLHLKTYGSYKANGTYIQNGSNNSENHLYEYFSGGRNYEIYYSELYLTNTNDTYLSGTFNLYLRDDTGNLKTVTGTFSAYSPYIM